MPCALTSKVERVAASGWPVWLSILINVCGFPQVMVAQTQIAVTNPLVGIGDSYYERSGVGFAFQMAGPGSQMFGNFGGLNFQQGSASSAIPPFGNYDPAGDATFGFSQRGDHGGFSLGFQMGKGSTRTLTGVAPSLVVPNGGFGSMFSGTLTPFVTGVIPVVGDPFSQPNEYYLQPSYASGFPPTRYRSGSEYYGSANQDEPETVSTVAVDRSHPDSTAAQADISVAEIKRRQANEDQAAQAAIDQLIDEAKSYEAQGDVTRAKLRYRKAIRLTTGQQRYELKLRLEALGDK